MDYFYDAQLRRYLLQFMRIFSGFQVAEGVRNGTTNYNKVPVRYADMQRMVAHILTKGSENMVNSTPFLACNVTSLLVARDRTQDPMLVSKVQVAERQLTLAMLLTVRQSFQEIYIQQTDICLCLTT